MAVDLKFVDQVIASPATRLDLNDGVLWRLQEGQTDFSPPPSRQTSAQSMLADGAPVTSSVSENRVVRLELLVHAATVDLAQAELGKLAVELGRERNVLRYVPNSSTAFFYRTFRSDIVSCEIHVDEVPGTTYRVVASVQAEPFAYGPKVTLSPVTVSNNPAAGSNGCYFDVSGILGDHETPLFFIASSGLFSTGPSFGRRTSCIAVRRRGTVANVPLVFQAEMAGLLTDTVLQANDATMSGSGSNYVRVTFTTSTALITRFTFTNPPVGSSVDARGRYRVFARVRRTTNTGTLTMRLLVGITPGNAGVGLNTVTLPIDVGAGAPTKFYMDLGLVSIPGGFDPVTDGFSGTEIASEGGWFGVQAGRPVAGSSLDIDLLLFVPADDSMLRIKWPASGTATDAVLDSRAVGGYLRNASGAKMIDPPTEPLGGPPMVSPGVTNRVFFVRDVGSGSGTDQAVGSGDVITDSTTLTPYYWPRYLR